MRVVLGMVLLALAAFAGCGSDDGPRTDDPFEIALIGDSYSAGNGGGDYYGPKGCFRSRKNWAERYRDDLPPEMDPVLSNRACSGAVLKNVYRERRMDVAKPTRSRIRVFDWALRLAGAKDPKLCPESNGGDEYYRLEPAGPSGRSGGVKAESKWECVRYLAPQWNGVSDATDLVLMTIGGNDVGFSRIVQHCFYLQPKLIERVTQAIKRPFRPDCPQRIATADRLTKKLPAELTRFLRQLKLRMKPEAKIVLLGYPYLEVDPDFRSCDRTPPPGLYPLGRNVRALGDRGTGAQRSAVDEVNAEPGPRVVYVDEIRDEFEGHEPDGCYSRTNHDGWIHDLSSVNFKVFYHYNSKGHEAVARILSRHGDFSQP